MATTQPIVQRVPGPLPGKAKSSLPALVLLVGWLVPGAGHLLLGKWIRGLLLFVSVLGMFLIGIGLQGKIYAPNTGDILDMLGFAGQLGMGLFYGIARVLSLGAPTVTDALGDYGTKFLIVAGLLNVIAAVDAHSLANGKKGRSVTLSHFSAALLFALFVSIVFGITQRSEPKMMVRLGVFTFALLIGAVIAASWVMWAIKH